VKRRGESILVDPLNQAGLRPNVKDEENEISHKYDYQVRFGMCPKENEHSGKNDLGREMSDEKLGPRT
jgi:hypothetical protein